MASHPFMAGAQAGGSGPFASSDPFSPGSPYDAPPPPYESVVMNDSEVPSVGGYSQVTSAAQRSEFDIVVKDPIKHGENVSAYVSYKVCTRTSNKQYRGRECEVIRRFRDFAWLHTRLTETHRGIIVPPLPEKNVVQKYQMTTDYIEQRRRALQVFINRVAAHPALKDDAVLQQFLESSEEDWNLEVSRATYQSGSGAKKKLATTLQMFRDLGHTTANLVSGKQDEEDEDPDYLRVREYVGQLEGHLGEVHRHAARLIKRQAELGASLSEFGAAMVGLGKFEQPPLADYFVSLGEKAGALASASQVQTDALNTSFEAPLKEFVRMVKSAKGVMADRSAALQTLHQARAEVDAKRTKLAKVRGVPGIKEEKIAEAERDVNEAAHRVEAATATYEVIVRRMSEELARFQRERATELSVLLRNFTVTQAKLAADTAQIWRTVLPEAANGSAH